MELLVCYLILINAVSLLLMLIDKQKAKRKQWRIPEAALFLTCIIGGSIGGNLGMYLFRHKTKHWYFAVGFPVILAIHALAAVYFLL